MPALSAQSLERQLDHIVERRWQRLDASEEYQSASALRQRELRRASMLDGFRQFYRQSFKRIRAQHENGAAAGDIVRLNTALVDVIIAKIWDVLQQHYQPQCTREYHEPAVIAVGGYGRAELNPCSDIDLLILAPHDICPHIEILANRLLYLGWDIGLNLSHSVRSIAECLEYGKDMSVRTAILESRCIAGSRHCWERFEREVVSHFLHRDTDNFIYAKLSERKERLKKQSASPYLLEPNLKEGAGGLRDVHVTFWVAHARYPDQDRRELWDFFGQEAALRSRDFLWRVRNELHYHCNRHQDILTFDLQQVVAARMGYRHDRRRDRLDVELFMRDYYRHTRRIRAATELILARCTPQRMRQRLFGAIRLRTLTDGFLQRGNELTFERNPDFFRSDPGRLLRLFATAQRRNLRIGAEVRLFIQKHLGLITDRLRTHPATNQVFMQILRGPNAANTLEQMHESGVLGRLIPEFGSLDCLVQFNRYHYYTADKHTLRTIQIYEDLERQCIGRQDLVCRVRTQDVRKDMLLLALLLHDIGKARAGDHSQKGADMLGPIAARMGLSRNQRSLLEFLIRHHLLMANTSQRRDLSDPRTLEIFCEQVDSIEKLNYLYALTICDIRAVGPATWTDWKGMLLAELYRAAAQFIRSGSLEQFQHERRQELRQQLRALDDLDPDILELFGEDMLLSSSLDDIRWATTTLQQLDRSDGNIVVRCRLDEYNHIADLFVGGYDLPGIFSHIIGAILVWELEVITCKVNTLQNGMILDIISLSWDPEITQGQPHYWDQLCQEIIDVLLGRRKLQISRSWSRRRPARSSQPAVMIHNDQSERCTLIEVFSNDKPGLLYKLSSSLYFMNLSVHAASITTRVEQVVDVFYVTDLLGQKITSPQRIAAIRARIGKLL